MAITNHYSVHTHLCGYVLREHGTLMRVVCACLIVIFLFYDTSVLSPNSISLFLISSSVLVYFSSVLPSNSSVSPTPTLLPTPHLSLAPLRPPHSTTKCSTVSSTAPHSKQSTAPPENLFIHLSSRVSLEH